MGNPMVDMALMTPILMVCPRCERQVTIPARHCLRLPHDDPNYCHEVVHKMSGAVHSKGEPR